MTCFRPLSAFRRPGGEVCIGVAPADCWHMELPCGKCIGCRMERKRQWTLRIIHEAQLYDANSFVTLTYSELSLPESLSLEYRDFQGFMKRLRRRCVGVSTISDGRKPIRFFVAGEYGGLTKRPHYHAILFNCDFPDKQPLMNGTFRSAKCEDIWKRGNVVIGAVTSASAAYVAGYAAKKVYGQAAAEFYEDVVNVRTGELSCRRPEFVQMSRDPGIGREWFARFASDVFPNDGVYVEGGQRYKVPRYYLDLYKREADAGEVEEIMYKRYVRAAGKRADNTPERRAVHDEYYTRKDLELERGL